MHNELIFFRGKKNNEKFFSVLGKMQQQWKNGMKRREEERCEIADKKTTEMNAKKKLEQFK